MMRLGGVISEGPDLLGALLSKLTPTIVTGQSSLSWMPWIVLLDAILGMIHPFLIAKAFIVARSAAVLSMLETNTVV